MIKECTILSRIALVERRSMGPNITLALTQLSCISSLLSAMSGPDGACISVSRAKMNAPSRALEANVINLLQ